MYFFSFESLRIMTVQLLGRVQDKVNTLYEISSFLLHADASEYHSSFFVFVLCLFVDSFLFYKTEVILSFTVGLYSSQSEV